MDWSVLSKSLGSAADIVQKGQQMKQTAEIAKQDAMLKTEELKLERQKYEDVKYQSEMKMWEGNQLKDFYSTESALSQAIESKNAKLTEYHQKRYNELAPSVVAQGAKYGRSIPVLNTDILSAMGEQAGEANRLMNLYASPQGPYMAQADKDKAAMYARTTIKDPQEALKWIASTQENHKKWMQEDKTNKDLNKATGGAVNTAQTATALGSIDAGATSGSANDGNLVVGAKAGAASSDPYVTQIKKNAADEDTKWQEAKGSVATDIATLRGVSKALKSNKDLTGNVSDFIPFLDDSARAAFNEPGANALDAVRKVVSGNLTKTLGAQFTEREGNKIISASYNPKVSTKENAARIDKLTASMELAAEEREKRAQYSAANNGDMRAYKGRSAAEIEAAVLASVGLKPEAAKQEKATGSRQVKLKRDMGGYKAGDMVTVDANNNIIQ